jgi:hypothetical protein
LRTAFPVWRQAIAKPQEWQFYSDYFASGFLEQHVQEMKKGTSYFWDSLFQNWPQALRSAGASTCSRKLRENSARFEGAPSMLSFSHKLCENWQLLSPGAIMSNY